MRYKLGTDFIIPEPDDVEIISISFDLLKTKFQPSLIDNLNFTLDGFEPLLKFANLGSQFIVDLNSLAGNKFIIHCLGASSYLHYRSRNDDEIEYQTWGILRLKTDNGNILIRKETTADKLVQFFKKTELDFEEDLQFSKSFYVLADDKIKAASLLNFQFRNAIAEIDIPDFAIIIKNKTLLIGNGNLIDVRTPLAIAKFLNKIN